MDRQDERDPADLLPLIPLVIVAIVVIYLVWPKKRCWRCRKRLTRFRHLDAAQQAKVYNHYHDHETRTPEPTNLHVCMNCQRVYDEYSLRDHRQTALPRPCKVCGGYLVDFFLAGVCPADLAEFAKAYPRLFTGEKCPRCRYEAMTTVGCARCDVVEPLRGCRACTTIHAWVPDKPGGFQYLVPLKDEAALDRFLSKSSQDAPV